MNSRSRRAFLERMAFATAAAALPATRLPPRAVAAGPNDTLSAAIIGCGIRGKAHAEELARQPDCRIAVVCDPDLDRVDELAAVVEGLGRPAPRKERDLRRVFDADDVDVAFIATPNHWHALAAVWAMEAGKDAYVEKPLSHDVAEGRRIVATARRLGRIVQTGMQNRSRGPLAEAIRFVRAGGIGEVKLARSVYYGRRGSIGGPGPCAMPPRCDYDLWAGPAPLAELRRPGFHYDWHWFWDTGNGEIGNNNVHSIDICRWGLGVTGMGRRVLSSGGRYGYVDAAETPNTQVAIVDFGDRMILSETRGLESPPFRDGVSSMWFFEGSDGFVADTHHYDPDGRLVKAFEGESQNHFANFLAAVRSRRREDLTAEAEEGHWSAAVCHAATISWRLGRPADPADVAAAGEAFDTAAVGDALDRTRDHLAAAGVDLAATPLVLGRTLAVTEDGMGFVDDAEATALLERPARPPYLF